MKAPVFPNLRQGFVWLIDCDERSQASLGKSLQRLGIQARALHNDGPCTIEGCFAAILEIEHFASPLAVQTLNNHAITLVALSAHETLSQIQRALRLGATALLNKPITQGSVYTTLMMAAGLRDRQRTDARQLADLQGRLAQRPLLSQAVARLMVSHHLTEAAAYERLRNLSMQLNRSIEALCAELIGRPEEGRA